MKETAIHSIDELIEKLHSFPQNYIYRGHSNESWRLESSLERVIGPDWSASQAKKFEEYSLQVFKSKFHLYDRENWEPASTLAWLALMQHYGVPTRMIDFTESPYVALYFALESYAQGSGSDFAVYALNYSALLETSISLIQGKDPAHHLTRQLLNLLPDEVFEEVLDKHDVLWVAEPRRLNTRLDRQAGSFLLSLNNSLRVEDALSLPMYANNTAEKIVIDHTLYGTIFALLRKMNITGKSLYGDLEGLARSIRMELKVYSEEPMPVPLVDQPPSSLARPVKLPKLPEGAN